MKKGFFNFFSKSQNAYSEEEKQQHQYAISKQSDEILDQIDKEDPHLGQEDVELFCKAQLEKLLSLGGFDGDVSINPMNDREVNLEITNTEDTGRLIGKEGNTIEAFQTLLKTFIYKALDKNVRVKVDVGNYKKRREDQLKKTALNAAKDVIETKEPVQLKPMNASERRFIHLLFEDHSQVQTTSSGQGDRRRVVLESRD